MAPGDTRRKRRLGPRAYGQENKVAEARLEFLNPYPWMSSIEARVHLELEHVGVPFTWRYFDGDLAPHLQELMPDFAPEFTLKEYKTVIVILGGYFSSIPGILDKTALAQALLEMDGWTVCILWEQDIYGDLHGTLAKKLPFLKNPPIKGPPRKPPIGSPDFMSRRRRALAAWAIHRAKYALDRQETTSDGRTSSSGRKRRNRRSPGAPRERRRSGS